MNLINRIRFLESRLTHREPKSQEPDDEMTDGEHYAAIEAYVAQRDLPGGRRIDYMEDWLFSRGIEDLADLRRDREWDENARLGFPRKWRHARKPNGKWSHVFIDEPLPPGWKFGELATFVR